MSETYYDLLGVSADASTVEIEAAYREAIKEVHPDVSDDVDAGERTKRLNKAKRVLTDEDERSRYDSLGHEAYTNGGPMVGSAGSSSGTGGESDAGNPDSGGGRRRGRRTGGTRRSGDRSRTGQRGGRPGGGAGTRSAGPDGPGNRTRSQGDPTHSTGPSRSSNGPTWQSSGASASAGGAGSDPGPSARRQAAAGATDGPNVDWSWNGWEKTRSWAVRQGDPARRGIHPSRLFPTGQSTVLLACCFLLYPFFVIAVLFPPFPLLARATVGVCTLLMFAYLLSVPEVAIVVYGVWSLLVPLVIFAVPGLSIFSLAGVVGLFATWVPLGFSVLTLSVVRP